MDPHPFSFALVIRPDDTLLPLSTRSECPVAIVGPGRTLHQVYSSTGRYVEKKANRIAHNLGLGPSAVTTRIQEMFGSRDERESKLDEFYRKRLVNLHELKKDCVKLMEHALPSEALPTQLQAFKSIVMLTTRYPGLRRLFLRCKKVQRAGNSQDMISALWVRVGCPGDREWLFFWRFAASCISDERKVGAMLEDTPPPQLGCVYIGELSIIERLLVESQCNRISDISTGIAIRYLGGILELPTFWVERNYQLHRSVAERLFKRTGEILKDIGVDSSIEFDESMTEVSSDSDTEGIDLLVDAILAGVQVWMQQMLPSDLVLECWFDEFVKLIKLLRSPRAEALVPRCWHEAATEGLWGLVPITYKYEVMDSAIIREYGTSDNRDDSPGQQFSEEAPYRLRQKFPRSQLAYDEELNDQGSSAPGVPTIPNSNEGVYNYTDFRPSSPSPPPLPPGGTRDVVATPQPLWHAGEYPLGIPIIQDLNEGDRRSSPQPTPLLPQEGSRYVVATPQPPSHAGDYSDEVPPLLAWDQIHHRLLSWATIWSFGNFDTALKSTTRGHQVNAVALSIWCTQNYKRFVRAKLLDEHVVDRLFVPPIMADAISNAVFNGQHGDACGMLRDLWIPFGLKGTPRLLIVLAKHLSDENHWVVHRFSLPDGALTTYDSYPEKSLPDGRALGWWFAIRLAWPNVFYLSPDHMLQKVIRLHRPMQLLIDNSVSAGGIWRNILMGSRGERIIDLERLRGLINTEVENLRRRKQHGKLSIGAPRLTWEDMN